MSTAFGGSNWLNAGEKEPVINYQGSMREAGWKELLDKQRLQELEGEIQADAPMFRFRYDFNLGDIVPIRVTRWGITTVRRIKEIEENWDDGVYTARIKIGDPKPTVLKEVDEKVRAGGGNVIRTSVS
ncbi:hypothetical protein FACS1894184_11670 [Clostridia bacterium]|nr:hypothetical protein FACS1894184_11670 [Clostridia bacterium]